jgi:hypothetical protein
MTSFYNLSKADPAIADSGGLQFVGQRKRSSPRSMVSVSASCRNRNSKQRSFDHSVRPALGLTEISKEIYLGTPVLASELFEALLTLS